MVIAEILGRGRHIDVRLTEEVSGTINYCWQRSELRR